MEEEKEQKVRAVVVQFVIKSVQVVPEDWTEEDINFKYGDPDSRWCGDNLLDELELRAESLSQCCCDLVEGTYGGEATKEDQEEYFGKIVVE
jgi:hypothetical protein